MIVLNMKVKMMVLNIICISVIVRLLVYVGKNVEDDGKNVGKNVGV